MSLSQGINLKRKMYMQFIQVCPGCWGLWEYLHLENGKENCCYTLQFDAVPPLQLIGLN